MAEPRMNELAEELLRRSRERKVPWEEGLRGEGHYRVVFPDGTLILTRGARVVKYGESPGEFQEYPEYQLALLSDTGRIIGSLTPEPDDPMYLALVEISNLAGNYVRDRGINKALDFLKSR